MKKVFLFVVTVILTCSALASSGSVKKIKTMKDITSRKPVKMVVLCYLQDGVEVLDFAGPVEVFKSAGFEVHTVGRTKSPILSQGVVSVTPEFGIEDAPRADILVFFGGGTSKPARDPAVMKWIKDSSVKYYMSVCTGAFILGKAGLLDNLTVTTWHGQIDTLKKAVPSAKVLSGVRYVDNGRVITTAGVSAGIDGALHLVYRILGKAVAEHVAKYMEYDKWVPEEGLELHKEDPAK